MMMNKHLLVMCGLFLGGMVFLLPHVGSHVAAGDSAELSLAATTLGVAHSPGYPGFVLLNNLLSKFIPFGNPAFQQNVVSCVWACLSVVLVGLIFMRLTKVWWPALLALSLYFSPLLRSQAYVTEVFSLTFCWGAFMILLFLQYVSRGKGLVLLSFLLGLSLGIHHTLVLLIPAFVTLYVIKNENWLETIKRDAVLSVLFFGLGATILLFLPIRSMADPFLDWEDPETLSRFWGVITRARYGFFQLTQGQEGLDLSAGRLLNALKISGSVLVSNLGFVGLGLMAYGAFVKAGRWFWVALFFTGPFFYWMADVPFDSTSTILDRFGLLFLLSAVLIMGLSIYSLWQNKTKIYRIAMVVLVAGFLVEMSIRPQMAEAKESERWNLALREIGTNIHGTLPKPAVLISDRADETEFLLAHKHGVEKPESVIRFIDANAGVTRSIYGDDYYEIWGEPRLRIRERVERDLIKESSVPVFYATVDAKMVAIPRTPCGLVMQVGLKKTRYNWGELLAWRFFPEKSRSRPLMRSYLDQLGRALFHDGYAQEANKIFGLAESLGGLGRHEYMGYLFQSAGLREKARSVYQHALSLGPMTEASYANLGTLETEFKRIPLAKAVYEEGITVHPQSDVLYFQLAGIYWRLQKWKEAASHLEKVLILNPNHSQARHFLKGARQRLRHSS